ncbi:MAG TPA: hypothetical protein VKV40_01945 [Ktedonobacteraceae bacterium]|nr:hypothetical protein [Ktedonobacteraceae bacterium]
MTTEKKEQESQSGKQLPPAKLLNANHRRVLGVTLRRVELAVWRLQERLAYAETLPQLTLTHFTYPANPLQRTALLQLTKQIREEIAQLATVFELEATEENWMRTTMAEFSLLWCDLEDVRPKKLDGYGPVHPQAYPVLDPPIQRLIQLVLLIDAVAQGRQDVLKQWQQAEKDDASRQEMKKKSTGEGDNQ